MVQHRTSSSRTTQLDLQVLEDRLVLDSSVSFVIDPQLNQLPISRFIYGVNESLNGAYSNLTFTRLGGNRWTAYNWENNASNAGRDWNFQNDGYLGGGNTPGGAVLPGLQNAYDHYAAIMLTVPINGYVSADKNGDGDVRNSGSNYLQTRFRQELATKGSAFTLTPNLNDGYVYQDEFVNWVNTNYPTGQTDPNRPIWYSLDNEPDLWSETHPEVHPNKVSYAELLQKSVSYAGAIKSVAPGSLVFGNASYGWNGYTTLQDAPDAAGRDFLNYYLAQMKLAEQTAGRRLLDVLDLHWYPEAQGGGVRITNQNNSSTVVAARLQAPRSLWDSTYTETSWITQWSTYGPINLLNRLEDKINANYAGTKLAITEYNYGGGDHISGGIAQADVLGIFGREGVYAASQWKLYNSEPFVAGAFSMYRNYDGNNSTFGDVSVSATTSSTVDSSIYASIDSANPNLITLVAINKTGGVLPATMNLKGVTAGSIAKFYTLTGNSSTPQFAGQMIINDPSSFAYNMPAYSVTTIRIEMNGSPPPVVPKISVADASVVEGNSGTTSVLFTVNLSEPATTPITVNWAIANGSASTGNGDYRAGSGVVTFAPGQTTQTITVIVNGDTTAETDETFYVRLNQPSGATILDGEATGTIRNDDKPSITVTNVSVTEGNSGTTNAVFTVVLSVPVTQTVSVNYTTANGTATAGSDYVAKSGTLTFSPGQTSKTISVGVIGDTAIESNETFQLLFSSAVNANLGTSQATGTILNDDQKTAVAVSWVIYSDWGSGYVMEFRIRNTGSTAINGWTLAFQLDANITNLWNGVIASRVGNTYTVRNESWNKTIAPGAEVNFGFVASAVSSASRTPKNLKLNGITL